MRIMHGILLLVMLAFMAVQYNDPDGPLWLAIYSAPALLMLIAVVRPEFYSTLVGRLGRWLIVAAMVAGVVYFFPTTAGFWRQEVWWETESAREGMGMMIAALIAASAFLARRKSA